MKLEKLVLLLLFIMLFCIVILYTSHHDVHVNSEYLNRKAIKTWQSKQKIYVKLSLKNCGIVGFENSNYTSSTTLSTSRDNVLVFTAYNLENNTHRCIFQYWKINGSILAEENPLEIENDKLDIVSIEPVYKVLAKTCTQITPLKNLLELDSMKVYTRYDSDYMEYSQKMIRFRNAFVYIPFKTPILLYNASCDSWLKISNIKFFVSSRTISPKFTIVLVLDNPVKVDDKFIYAIGYLYHSRAKAASYVIKERILFDGSGTPKYAYQLLFIDNKLENSIAISVLDILDKNFLPNKLFSNNRIVGVFVYGFDQGYLDLDNVIVSYEGEN